MVFLSNINSTIEWPSSHYDLIWIVNIQIKWRKTYFICLYHKENIYLYFYKECKRKICMPCIHQTQVNRVSETEAEINKNWQQNVSWHGRVLWSDSGYQNLLSITHTLQSNRQADDQTLTDKWGGLLQSAVCLNAETVTAVLFRF